MVLLLMVLMMRLLMMLMISILLVRMMATLMPTAGDRSIELIQTILNGIAVVLPILMMMMVIVVVMLLMMVILVHMRWHMIHLMLVHMVILLL